LPSHRFERLLHAAQVSHLVVDDGNLSGHSSPESLINLSWLASKR
jgi:hypothetical protein